MRWLNDCGITEANCDRLAAFLEFFPNLEELHFSDNPINTEMARNILEVRVFLCNDEIGRIVGR